MVPRTFFFIFHAGSRRLGSNNFRNSSYKEKTGFGSCFQTIFPFLMTMMKAKRQFTSYSYDYVGRHVLQLLAEQSITATFSKKNCPLFSLVESVFKFFGVKNVGTRIAWGIVVNMNFIVLVVLSTPFKKNTTKLFAFSLYLVICIYRQQNSCKSNDIFQKIIRNNSPSSSLVPSQICGRQ